MSKTKLIKAFNLVKYKILFCLVVGAYMLIYAPYGLTEADDGFITGLSWRIFNGELIYKDFIYVRPPLSPLFHALPFYILPVDYVIIFERFFFYLSIALSSLFAAKSLGKLFDFSRIGVDPYLLSTVGFVFSVATFLPTAWHTVDGILFGSVGIYFVISGRSQWLISLGIFFLTLSALVKQSFYFMPFAGVLYLFLSNPKTVKISTIFLTSLLIIVGAFLWYVDILGEFLLQSSFDSSIKDAYTAGIYSYIHTDLIFVFIPLFVWRTLKYFTDFKGYSFEKNVIPYLFASFIFAYPMAFYLNRILIKQMSYGDFLIVQFRDEFAVVTFLLACLFVLFYFKELSNPWGSILILFLSWSSSISWAHPSPHLFSTPIIMIFVVAVVRVCNVNNVQRYLYFLLITGLVSYFLGYQKPHYNDLRTDMVYDMSEVVPALRFVKGDKRMYDKLTDLSKLVMKYGHNSKVSPAMPLANLFYNSNSPIPVDYVINCEVSNKDDLIYDILVNKKTVVFLDRDWLLVDKAIEDKNRKYGSKTAIRVLQEWHLVDSLKSYYVYSSSKN